jgi:hypothetical protein
MLRLRDKAAFRGGLTTRAVVLLMAMAIGLPSERLRAVLAHIRPLAFMRIFVSYSTVRAASPRRKTITLTFIVMALCEPLFAVLAGVPNGSIVVTALVRPCSSPVRSNRPEERIHLRRPRLWVWLTCRIYQRLWGCRFYSEDDTDS